MMVWKASYLGAFTFLQWRLHIKKFGEITLWNNDSTAINIRSQKSVSVHKIHEIQRQKNIYCILSYVIIFL